MSVISFVFRSVRRLSGWDEGGVLEKVSPSCGVQGRAFWCKVLRRLNLWPRTPLGEQQSWASLGWYDVCQNMKAFTLCCVNMLGVPSRWIDEECCEITLHFGVLVCTIVTNSDDWIRYCFCLCWMTFKFWRSLIKTFENVVLIRLFVDKKAFSGTNQNS